MSTDTYSHEGPQCPYCLRQYTADDPYYYDDMNYTEETCDACGKTFSVAVYTSTSWTCEPIQTSEAPPIGQEPTLATDALTVQAEPLDILQEGAETP